MNEHQRHMLRRAGKKAGYVCKKHGDNDKDDAVTPMQTDPADGFRNVQPLYVDREMRGASTISAKKPRT